MIGATPDPACPRKRRRPHKLRWLSKPAEVVLYALVVSGGLLFDPFGVSWSITRWALAVHIVLAMTLVPLVVLPFWAAHRGVVRKDGGHHSGEGASSHRHRHHHAHHRDKARRRRSQARLGRVIEVLMAALLLAGVWLVAVGNNGTAAGAAAHWIHLVLAVPLALLVAVHAWRHSVLRLASLVVVLGAAAALPTPAAAAAAPGHAVESRSLLAADGGKVLWSADFDAGAVSKIDRATG
jgi:hypothetical protein